MSFEQVKLLLKETHPSLSLQGKNQDKDLKIFFVPIIATELFRFPSRYDTLSFSTGQWIKLSFFAIRQWSIFDKEKIKKHWGMATMLMWIDNSTNKSDIKLPRQDREFWLCLEWKITMSRSRLQNKKRSYREQNLVLHFAMFSKFSNTSYTVFYTFCFFIK